MDLNKSFLAIEKTKETPLSTSRRYSDALSQIFTDLKHGKTIVEKHTQY